MTLAFFTDHIHSRFMAMKELHYALRANTELAMCVFVALTDHQLLVQQDFSLFEVIHSCLEHSVSPIPPRSILSQQW